VRRNVNRVFGDADRTANVARLSDFQGISRFTAFKAKIEVSGISCRIFMGIFALNTYANLVSSRRAKRCTQLQLTRSPRSGFWSKVPSGFATRFSRSAQPHWPSPMLGPTSQALAVRRNTNRPLV